MEKETAARKNRDVEGGVIPRRTKDSSGDGGRKRWAARPSGFSWSPSPCTPSDLTKEELKKWGSGITEEEGLRSSDFTM